MSIIVEVAKISGSSMLKLLYPSLLAINFLSPGGMKI